MKNNVKVKDDTQSLQSCVSVSVTELRIGNLLKYKHLSEVSTMSAVDIMHISDDNSNVEPIPLTEEWLLKFGFKFRKNMFHYKIHFRIGFKKSFNKGFDLFIDDNILGNEIQYVHQLQNLYYALTGSELQIGNLTEH